MMNLKASTYQRFRNGIVFILCSFIAGVASAQFSPVPDDTLLKWLEPLGECESLLTEYLNSTDSKSDSSEEFDELSKFVADMKDKRDRIHKLRISSFRQVIEREDAVWRINELAELLDTLNLEGMKVIQRDPDLPEEISGYPRLDIEQHVAAGTLAKELYRVHKEKLDRIHDYITKFDYAKIYRELGNYNRKFHNGFPLMPWEAVWNYRGGDYGPSRKQLVWLHPSVGLEVAAEEDAVQVEDGYEAVLVAQILGYNHYFFGDNWADRQFRRLNYLGFAGILTYNEHDELSEPGFGAIIHLGNTLSIGGSSRDEEYYLVVSSSNAVPLLLRIVGLDFLLDN